MSNIIEFVLGQAKEPKTLEDRNGRKIDAQTYALNLLAILENYTDHFGNHYHLSEKVNEHVSNEFEAQTLELKKQIKTILRYIASRRLAEILHQGPAQIEELLQGLKILHKNEIAPFKEWFDQLGIPLPKSQVIPLNSFRNIWV